MLLSGKIIIKKIDGETGYSLKGATFELWQGNIKKRTETTDDYGNVTFSNIPFGTYELYETKAPEGGYSLEGQDGYNSELNIVDCGTYSIKPSTKNQVISLTITNSKTKNAKIRIKKKDYITIYRI